MSDGRLGAACEDTFDEWGIFGFSVLGLGEGGYAELARLIPLLSERQWLMEAITRELLAGGFPVLPTGSHPHWTVVVSEPTALQFARVRRHFSEPRRNPVWSGKA